MASGPPKVLLAALALSLVLCLGPGVWAGAELEGVQTDNKGTRFIKTDDGAKWKVVQKEGSSDTLFLNEVTKEISQTDPRTLERMDPRTRVKDVQQDHEGNFFVDAAAFGTFLVFAEPEQGRVYFHNPESGITMWEDPRQMIDMSQRINLPDSKPASIWDTLSVGAVVTVPVLLFIGALFGRIYYLHNYYPELLFPTKERKDRRRTASGKLKAQKARGKMSQDGKGGRSANS